MWERVLGGLAIIGALIIGIVCVPVVIGFLVLGLVIFVLGALYMCALFLLFAIPVWLKEGYFKLRGWICPGTIE